MTMPDWDELQPKFAEIVKNSKSEAIRRAIGCSKAQVCKWARGEHVPTIRAYQESVRMIVARSDRLRLSRPRPPGRAE